jgi:hypothetical protein
MNVQKINGTIEVGCPDGYEVDMEKSKFGLETVIHFKPIEIKKELPKRWEYLGMISGYYVKEHSKAERTLYQNPLPIHKNIFATEAQANAAIALAQLSQLREVYRQGWVPNWNTEDSKYVIESFEGKIGTEEYSSYSSSFLSFQSSEIRDEFLRNFRELIEEASPLLFG